MGSKFPTQFNREVRWRQWMKIWKGLLDERLVELIRTKKYCSMVFYEDGPKVLQIRTK